MVKTGIISAIADKNQSSYVTCSEGAASVMVPRKTKQQLTSFMCCRQQYRCHVQQNSSAETFGYTTLSTRSQKRKSAKNKDGITL